MKTPILNRLFDKWKKSYPKVTREGFHADGIIDESQFVKQNRRILFILTEPNSRGGLYDRFRGMDLREVFRQEHPKTLTRNLGLWIYAILDGESKFRNLNASEACNALSRVALLNLKKYGGSSIPDLTAVGIHAWQDRDFIRKEITIIAPDLILTCGKQIHQLFGAIMHDDRFWSGPMCWQWSGVEVINIQHPATRGKHTIPAFEQVLEVARRCGANRRMRAKSSLDT